MDKAPRKIGRFEIRRELGRGMMGVVYEAHDPVLDRTVALKTVNPVLAAGEEELQGFERRFETEARTAARLSHPNIVVVHDQGRDSESGTLYIALERLAGESLAHVLKRGERLPWRQVLDIVRQLADALHHAHSQGVVHRDIKPGNVMLLPTGQAKLMDFGIAKVEAAQMTAAGQFFGTPLFMCPEQAASGRVDGRGDIFSLGSVLYTLLTGRHAFAANSIAVIVYRVANEDPPAPSTLNRELGPDVDAIVARCLAKIPADRYQDAVQLSEDLSDVLEGRPPRHALGAPPPRQAAVRTTDAPPPAMPLTPTVTLDPREESSGPPTRTLVAAARPDRPDAGRRRRRRRILATGAAVWLAALAIGVYYPQIRSALSTLWRGAGGALSPDTTATPAVAAGGPESGLVTTAPEPRLEVAPEPTPEPTPTLKAALPPATIVVDFRHALRSGTLRIWMDDEKLLGEPVRGGVAKDLLLVKLRSGVFTDVMQVEPGRHDFRVDVRWDDEARSEKIRGRVYSGQTYRLEIRLGRIQKDLSLRWTR